MSAIAKTKSKALNHKLHKKKKVKVSERPLSPQKESPGELEVILDSRFTGKDHLHFEKNGKKSFKNVVGLQSGLRFEI